MKDSDLTSHCGTLYLALKDGENWDIDGIELKDELKDLGNIIDKKMTPLETLNYIQTTGLHIIFPNTVIALRILLTLPVTVASAERSFSKLKLVKTYLRSSLGNEKLSNLTILSIEADVAESLDYSDLIDSFSKQKVRRVRL